MISSMATTERDAHGEGEPAQRTDLGFADQVPAALVAVSLLPAGFPVGVPEKREVGPMVEENTVSVAPEGGGLLVAKRKSVAARTRAEQESDVSSGRSDGND